jgi:hypothetical protein
MSNQIVISSGAKVRDLNGVLTGTSGIVSSVPLGAANGVATLDSGGKVPVSQLPSSVVTYLGTWNAATNTPTLVNGTGDAGDMYICNVAGTVNFGAGPVTFAVGDWVLYGSGTWQKSNGQNGTVTSVAVTESGDALTITGSPITTAGTINIGFAGTSGQYVNGAGGLTTFPSLAGFVTSVTATAPLLSSGGTTPDLSIPAASSTVDGYLDNADWTTFNNKQNAITLTTTGTSGVSTLIGSTLNIPNYSTDLSGYVPYTGATANVNLGTFDLTADVITGATGSFASSGGSDTFAINHSSGSGIALNITKGGNGEGLYINKTSGSGNAATIIGTLNATTLVKSGGTSSQFLKADGSVDSSAYITLTSLSGGTGITYNNTTGVITNSAPDQTVSLTQGAGISISGTYPSFTIASTITQYTDALARAALSFVAGSGAYNSTTGVITIPTNNNQITNGSNFITLTSLSAGAGINYNNTTGAISSTITQYTDALARAAISLTTTGTSGAATYNSTTGVFNIPQYTDQYVGTVTSVGLSSATSGVTIGSTPITTSGTITLAIATASGSQNGLLSSTDWTTFNNKYNLPSLTSGSVLFSNGSTIAQDNANFFWDDTNNRLGIGTATPSFSLDVVKAGANAIRAYNSDSGSVDAYFIAQNTTTAALFGTNNVGPYLYTASALDMQFYTATVERLRIFSDGNILIGNAATNAGYKLDVSGTGRFTGALTGTSAIFSSSVTAGGNILVPAGSGLAWSGDASRIMTPEDNVSGALIQTPGIIRFNAGSTEKMRITSGGNVGIGTQSPSQLLEASKSQDADSVIQITNTNAGTAASAQFYAGNGSTVTQFFHLGTGYTGSGVLSGSANGGGIYNATSNGLYLLAVNAAGSIKFATGGFSQTMILNSSGNLGLGVTPSAWGSPVVAMQVGTASINSITSGANAGFSVNRFFNGSANAYITDGFATNFTQTNGAFAWFTAPSGTAGNAITFTQAMTLDASGNLGVGATAPYNKLTIQGSAARMDLNDGGGASRKALIIEPLGYNSNAYARIESYNYGTATGGNLVINTTGGNVLIGTTTDAGYKLDVNGTGRFSGTVLAGNSIYLIGSLNNSAKIQAGKYLSIADDGFNVGIGYSSDTVPVSTKLAINGNLYANGAATFSSSITATQFNVTSGGGGLNFQSGDAILDFNSSNIRLRTFKVGTGYITPLLIDSQTGASTFSSSVTATSFFESSDSRLKILVKDYQQPKGIENVAARMYVKNSKQELGYYAQDLQEILPSAVSEGEDGFLNLSYSQVHTAKIAYLEKEVAELKELIKSLL